MVAASGAVTLAGTLGVDLTGGFQPSTGSTFNAVSGSSVTGTFSSVYNAVPQSAYAFSVTYTPTAASRSLPLWSSAPRPGQASIVLDPGSDSGVKGDDLTNVTTPTFDVTVNEAGTILVDYKGDGTATATQTVSAAGTYQFTAPMLAAGTYTTKATFTPTAEPAVTSNVTTTIDTTAPTVLSSTPTGTVNDLVDQVDVTFSKLINVATLNGTNLSLSGPGGAVTVGQGYLLGGTTYGIPFAAQRANGAYQFTVGPRVSRTWPAIRLVQRTSTRPRSRCRCPTSSSTRCRRPSSPASATR